MCGQWGRGPGVRVGSVEVTIPCPWPAPPCSLNTRRSGAQVSVLSLLLLKYKESILEESFVCLDYVDLGFDDIMREESAGLSMSEDQYPMSEAGSGHYPEAEEAGEPCQEVCQGEGDIISDIERIQRALAGDIYKLKKCC